MTAGTPAKEKKFHYAWLIFLGCCCMMAGGMACVLTTAGVFYVPVCDELGFSRGEISLYLSFYLVSMVIASPIVGNLLPKVNVRIVMTIGCIAVVLAEAAMSQYTMLWQWYLSGTIFGLFGTFIFILPTPLMIGNWFKKHTGLVLGIAMSFSGIGAAIWSPLFTYCIGAFGWRTTYIIVACIIGILILPWTIFVFRFRPADMGLLPYGATEEEIAREKAEQEALASMSEEERAQAKSKIPGVAAKAAVLSIPFACIFILSGCEEFYGGISNNIPAFALSIGESATFGAALLSVVSVGNIVIKISVGYLADRIGIIKAVYCQMLVCLCACLIFAIVRVEWALYVGAFLLGVQNSVVTVSEPMLVRHFFGERSYAQVYSYIRVAAGLLGSVGMPIVGFIYDMTGGYEMAFIVGAIIAVFLMALTFIATLFGHRLPWEGGPHPDGTVGPEAAAKKALKAAK